MRTSTILSALAAVLCFTLTMATASGGPQQGAAPSGPGVQGSASPGVQGAAEPGMQSKDPGWPRTFTKNGASLVIHQPQVDSWKDHDVIVFRCAVEVTLAGTTTPCWGVLAAQGNTSVDENNTDVAITNLKVTEMNFPGQQDANAAAMKALVLDMLPNQPVVHVALQRVMAYMHNNAAKPASVPLNLQPPPIYYSSTPAVLVIFMGQPSFQPIPDTQLMWAVNTNWVVLMDGANQQYYLMLGTGWMTAPDPLKGPWVPVTQLPGEFLSLPTDGQWTDVVKNIPAQPVQQPPTVVTSTVPAELIVTQGLPTYSPIPGTSLMYVNNPATPVFWDARTSLFYYLVAGRWFSAPNITGPWTAASASLPAEFSKIPADSPMSFVLASVPGTVEADDAVFLAQVPHKSTIKIEGTTVTPTYNGPPKFVPIEGTTMTYANNSAYSVIDVNGTYYCCYQGMWFQAPTATGPWVVCTSVPQVIYTIPPSCPLYNCTYVYVYGATPTTVTVGYTSGYSGAYVAATGALMFGAGMAVGAVLANNCCCCCPCYYSYGCAPYYHYGYCGYCSAGYAHYGPYGGAGWEAGYNPATGNYYRGGAAYSGNQGRWGGQAYNPWTNTYAQHTGGTNGYQSWGNSYVQQGNKWAQAGHESTAAGGVGYAENSKGQWAEGAHSNATDSTVAKTSDGYYAGHDGNVYKNTGDGWEKYDNGSWNQVQKPSGSNASSSSWADHDNTSSLNKDAWSRNYGNGGSSGWNGDRSNGGGGWGGSGRSNGGWGGGGGWGGRSGGGGRSFGGGGFRR
ncbi:MAG: hypothetical protein U0636_07440 [Phycisphaerales bacterium]